MFREKIREGKISDPGIDGDRVRLGLKNCWLVCPLPLTVGFPCGKLP